MKLTFVTLRPTDHPLPIFSWLIIVFQGMNLFDKKSYSHMAIFYEKDGQKLSVDVPYTSGRLTTQKDMLSRYRVTDEITVDMPQVDPEEFVKWAKPIEGVKYDVLQIVGLMIKALTPIRFNSLGFGVCKMICCELIVSFLQNFDTLEVKDTDNWDLNMTWNLVKELKGREK